MTWERFGYICRKASAEYKDEELISDTLSRVSEEDACDLYGRISKRDAWPKKIINDIASFKNNNDAIEALSIYKKLSLSKQFEEPMKFKRVLAYLSYITFIFLGVTFVYRLYVLPSFTEIFETFDISNQSPIGNFQEYWAYFFLVTIFILIMSLFIGFHLRGLFKFHVNIERSFVFRYLMFPNIQRSYKNVLKIISFPLLSIDDSNDQKNAISKHLHSIHDANMCVANEMHELLEIEMRNLSMSCERQMKIIYVFVSIVIIYAILSFLSGVYSPIFSLGAVI